MQPIRVSAVFIVTLYPPAQGGGVAMKSVDQILRSKALQGVATIAPSATVQEAAALMAGKRIGALVVMADDAIVGIVSERDMARRMVQADRPATKTKVSEIMT